MKEKIIILEDALDSVSQFGNTEGENLIRCVAYEDALRIAKEHAKETIKECIGLVELRKKYCVKGLEDDEIFTCNEIIIKLTQKLEEEEDGN